jgi:phosphatidylglycerol lysyltransferase
VVTATVNPPGKKRSWARSVVAWADFHRDGLGLAAVAVVLLLCGFALNRLLAEMRVADVGQAIRQLPGSAILLCLGFTALSYITLIGYDWSALRYVGRRLPARVIAVASFCGYAIGNTVGFSLLTGGSVRFRIYSAAGLSADDIGRVAVFCIVAFGFGICAVSGIGVLLRPRLLSEILNVPVGLLKAVSIGLIVGVASFLTLCARRRVIGWRRGRLPLPSVSLVAVQLTISAIDLVFASAALWVLVPPELGFSFLAFLPLYCVAIVAGVMSHVPGGLGVFEAVFVYALSDRTEIGPLVGALLVYRLIYYVLPLLAAGALLGLNELRRQIPATLAAFDRLVEVTGEIVPTAASVLVVLAGIVLLASGATPMNAERAALIGSIVPLPVIEASHFLGGMVASILISLGPALQRRLNAAYWLAHAFLAAGIACSLAKGFDYEEAIILAFIAFLMVPYRKEFYRRTSLLDEPFTLPWTVAMACIMGAAIWLTLFAYKHVPYDHALWFEFALDADASRSLRAMLAAFLALAILAAMHLLHPPRRAAAQPSREDIARAADIARHQDRADALLVLMRDKQVLFSETGRSFLMYGRHGGSCISLFDPIGPAEEREELIWRFRELCDRQRSRPAFYQIKPDNLPLYADVGLTLTRLGDEARVPLTRFALERPTNRELRRTYSRALREGLVYRTITPSEVPGFIEELAVTSGAWLSARKGQEQAFSFGAFSPGYISNFDVAAVLKGNEVVAFATLLVTDGGAEASADLVRHRPDVLPSTMEFLVIAMLLELRARGCAWFSLGMAPLSDLERRRLAPLRHRLAALVFEHGEQFYNVRCRREFKERFLPVWEPRYLASPGGVEPSIVLADAAALIGGPRPG